MSPKSKSKWRPLRWTEQTRGTAKSIFFGESQCQTEKKDGYQGLFVKRKNPVPLFRKGQVVKRWEENFDKFFSECRAYGEFTQSPPVEGPVKK